MEEIIYVQLLGEGTTVYRPVAAVRVRKGVYRISENDLCDTKDEEWEFLPGSTVDVELKELSGQQVLVATNKHVNGGK